jgi:hypothetical protein
LSSTLRTFRAERRRFRRLLSLGFRLLANDSNTAPGGTAAIGGAVRRRVCSSSSTMQAIAAQRSRGRDGAFTIELPESREVNYDVEKAHEATAIQPVSCRGSASAANGLARHRPAVPDVMATFTAS